MSDQEDDKKILNDDASQPEDENQSKIDSENQSQSDQNQNLETTSDRNETKTENLTENQNLSADEKKIDESESSSHQVIHKKDGRLHIYVRQDKYKGELKSKNWVGRLYIDGKQKISSSGTTNLDEAIPILEKWYDDVIAESERLKKQSAQSEVVENQTNLETEKPITNEQPVQTAQASEDKNLNQNTDNKPIEQENPVQPAESTNVSKSEQVKNKLSNIFGKIKDIKIKKPTLPGIKSQKTSSGLKNNFKSKLEGFFKSKLGKSSVQGEEILGVELSNKEIRLAQITTNKANQWVLEKFETHKIEIADESSVLDNAEKFTEELRLVIQKNKITTPNAALSIPVTSAIIRVVTAPLMKDEELQKAIETNSLWENLVQLTDNLDDYSIFHQVINKNEKANTMDILFVASKLADINSYTTIIKNAGLNPVIIDVKCFALKSAVDQINQISNKTEDANLTAVLEFGLDENYLMILYDNNPIITDIFLRGLDRKILLGSDDIEEKEGLIRRYVTQVKQAIQDFETKYEKRIRNIKVVSDIDNVEEYLSFFRKNLMNVGFNLFDPTDGLQIPKQFEDKINLENKSYLTTAIGLAFRKLDVFGYYKFVTAVKNINLLPNRQSMFKQKKMKAISGFAFKGIAASIAALYIILFSLSFWNIYSYNKQLADYDNVKKIHKEKGLEDKKISKELKLIETTLKLSRTLKSNKELTYRVLAQIASSVPNRVKFDKVEYNGKYNLTIQGIAATDQDILRFIDNLSKQKLIEQASLSSMKLPRTKVGEVTMKGFRVFVKIKRV
ncbi:pilus assembly protein PilM [Candidatus Pelagibacter sp.]|uniref:pilus assembly protein PilM n=1 Tax=Candidatus Pelagibacter sp. TaxID=2024849 RepID=UPI003F8642CC